MTIDSKYEEIVDKLLQLDKDNNICSIELQSDSENSAEINVIYKDYDAISEELWEYTLSFNKEITIDNFGLDQEIPNAKRILFKREEV